VTPRRLLHFTLNTILAFVAVSLVSACDRSSMFTASTVPTLRVQDIVVSVSADASPGAARSGAPPLPGNGPTVSVAGNQTIINGGTLPVQVAGRAPFDTIYMVVAAKTVGLASEAPGGVDGFYEIHLPALQSAATALLAFPQTFPLRSFDLRFAVAASAGPIGPFATLTTTPIEVGSGDVQVTLSWDVDSDVDLHVVDPANEEIFYAHLQSASGGKLDLDSNAACALDHKRNENITWPVGRAPRGQYTVRVDYWDACGVGATNYTVRINNNAGSSQIFTASFERTSGATVTALPALSDLFSGAALKKKGRR